MSEIPVMVMPWHRPDPCRPSKMQTNAVFKASHMDYMASLDLDAPTLSINLTGIMCTIGTASNTADRMVDLMEHGMNMALVPLALGIRQDHVNTIAKLREANMAYNNIKSRVYPVAIAVQTKGPGLRIGGLVKDVPIELPLKHKVTLTTDKVWRTKCTEHFLYVNFPDMSHVLTTNDVLLIGNGVVILQVEVVDPPEVVCQVVGGGVIQSYMPLSIPDVPILLPSLTDEDVDDLRMAASLGVDIVVATHTQSADHIDQVRKVLVGEENGAGIKIWAQLETKKSIENLDSILKVADAILFSRISLTQDLPPEKLFLAQKMVLAASNKVGVPVFVSAHYLPSMQADVNPSVTELNDVASAVLDGADGFLLRNTTSIGKYPDHTVKTLTEVCRVAEAAVWHYQTFSFLNSQIPPPIDPSHAIAISAVEASLKAGAAAILLATTSGRSAQVVARYRPRCPILAVTRYGQVARQLNTWRAIVPLHYVEPPLPDWTREVDVRLQFAIEYCKERGIVSPGDTMVLLNGWRKGAGFTNTIRIVYASEAFPWVYPHALPVGLIKDEPLDEKDEGETGKSGRENISPKGSRDDSKVDTKSNSKRNSAMSVEDHLKALGTTLESIVKSRVNDSKEIRLHGERENMERKNSFQKKALSYSDSQSRGPTVPPPTPEEVSGKTEFEENKAIFDSKTSKEKLSRESRESK